MLREVGSGGVASLRPPERSRGEIPWIDAIFRAVAATADSEHGGAPREKASSADRDCVRGRRIKMRKNSGVRGESRGALSPPPGLPRGNDGVTQGGARASLARGCRLSGRWPGRNPFGRI